MKSKIRRIQILLGIFLCCIMLFACDKQEEVPVAGGYKPAFYYQEEYYWLSPDRPLTSLPEEYEELADKIVGSESNAMVLPTKELYATAFGSILVGKTLYRNPEDTTKILVKHSETLYEVFENTQEK